MAVFSLHTRALSGVLVIREKKERKEKKRRKNTEQVGRQVASLAFSPVEKCGGRCLYTVERI